MPFKCSFHLWRVLRGKILTNEKLIKFGKQPVGCYCCYQQGQDTLDHIFVTRNCAKHIWKSVSATFGFNDNQPLLKNKIMAWWNAKSSNGAYNLAIQSVPILVCWNLWKKRCAVKYGGKTTNVTRIKFAIYKELWSLLHTAYPYINWPSNWNDLIDMVSSCVHEFHICKVRWTPPFPGMVKLAMDGSCLGNPGSLAAGGSAGTAREISFLPTLIGLVRELITMESFMRHTLEWNGVGSWVLNIWCWKWIHSWGYIGFEIKMNRLGTYDRYSLKVIVLFLSF